ncbi:hypothetical protein BDV3_006587 [Batrachochytrium dendrobatidis]
MSDCPSKKTAHQTATDHINEISPISNTQNEVMNLIWGFDPIELLTKTVFPNHHLEQLLRYSKDARMLAIRKLSLDILGDPEAFQNYKRVYTHKTHNQPSFRFNTKPYPSTTVHTFAGNITPSSWSISERNTVHEIAHAGLQSHTQRNTPATIGTVGSQSNLFHDTKTSTRLGVDPSHHLGFSNVSSVQQKPKVAGESKGNAAVLINNASKHLMHQQAKSANLVGQYHKDSCQPYSVLDGELSAMEKISRTQLARSAASLLIQSCFRGWRTRKRFIAVMHARLSIQTFLEVPKILEGLPDVKDLTTQELVWRRYLQYCHYFDKRKIIPPEYSQFCAAYIQSIWRCFVVRRAYVEIQTMCVDKSNVKAKLEARIRLVRYTQRPRAGDRVVENSASKIQRVWRRYYSMRIYKFYRNLIKYSEQGNPKRLLKFINPKEAQYVDDSLGTHIRFRLGGHIFPPTIYYKVFVHKSIVDMNAFSPRNYTDEKIKTITPRQRFHKGYILSPPSESEEWYQRFENNEWRPVSDATWGANITYLHNAILPTQSKRPFHHIKLKRHQDMLKRRKERKLDWMRHIYQQGLETVYISAPSPPDPLEFVSDITKGLETNLDQLKPLGGYGEYTHPTHTPPHTAKSNPKAELVNQLNHACDEKEIEALLKDAESEFDSDFLIKWTRALDFESYQENWSVLATTHSHHPKKWLNDCDQMTETRVNDVRTAPLNRLRGMTETSHVKPKINSHSRSLNGTADLLLPDLHVRKQRPVSGRSDGSDRSIREMLLTDHDIDAF